MSKTALYTRNAIRLTNAVELEQLNSITEKIIGCAFIVHNTLGGGFLEKVYENALAHELSKAGMKVEQQLAIRVNYDGIVVGDFYADLIIEDAILVELKAVKALDSVHLAQCLNYLKATGLRLCMLLYFGATKVEIKRVVV